jgi:hypothetical protein
MQAWGWLQNPTEALINPIHEPPSANYWFGTSRSGYDVFSRTLFASRAAWQVVILATSLSLFIGVPLGLVSGYLGGKLDRVLLFLMDTIYTLPGLLLSLTLAFVVGKGVLNAAIALSISYIPQYYRVVRNHTVSVKTELFVEAARAMGADSAFALPVSECDSERTGAVCAQRCRCNFNIRRFGISRIRTSRSNSRMGTRLAFSFRCATYWHLVDSFVSRFGNDFNGSGTIFGGGRIKRICEPSPAKSTVICHAVKLSSQSGL